MPTAPQPLRARKPRWPAAPPWPAPVEYPELDGKPMAETPIHMEAMNDAIMPLKKRYAERTDVYAGGNMMMYNKRRQGRPARRRTPRIGSEGPHHR